MFSAERKAQIEPNMPEIVVYWPFYTRNHECGFLYTIKDKKNQDNLRNYEKFVLIMSFD